MAKRIPFAELYKAGLAEPQTPYQKRIARGVDRGLTTAQARGHARTDKGEKSITQLFKSGKLPKITRRERYTKVVNNRWVTHEFGVNPDHKEMGRYLHQISRDGQVDIQVVVHGYSEHYGRRIPDDAIELEYHSRIERFTFGDDLTDDELDEIAERLERIEGELQQYGIAQPKTSIRVRAVFE